MALNDLSTLGVPNGHRRMRDATIERLGKVPAKTSVESTKD
jgi:hypothetical protein